MRSVAGARPMSRTKVPVCDLHAARLEPGDQGLDEGLVLADRRAQDVPHVLEVREQAQRAVDVAAELGRAVLRQRPHDGRPEQPELGLEEVGGEELLDPAPVHLGFRRQRELHEVEAVVQAQSVMRAVQDLTVAVDDVRSSWNWFWSLKVKNSSLTDTEGSRFDGTSAIRLNVQRNSESNTEPGRLYPLFASPPRKKPPPGSRFRLVDRDVGAGHACVPDEICGCGQSAESTADDMRLHRPPLRLPFW